MVHESGAINKTKCHKVAVVSLGEAGQHHCDFTKGGGGGTVCLYQRMAATVVSC